MCTINLHKVQTNYEVAFQLWDHIKEKVPTRVTVPLIIYQTIYWIQVHKCIWSNKSNLLLGKDTDSGCQGIYSTNVQGMQSLSGKRQTFLFSTPTIIAHFSSYGPIL